MPHIRIRSMTDSQVQALSQCLPAELSKIIKTPEENFTFEAIATQFYLAGKMVNSDPMIEVLWFDRGQAAKDACAEKITQFAKQFSAASYIAVIFISIPQDSYYENGKHFG